MLNNSNTIFSILLLALISCQAPKIYIPGNNESSPVFWAPQEINLTKDKISDARDLNNEYPEYNFINKNIKQYIDFRFNEQYDSTSYLKLFEKEKLHDKVNKDAKLTTRPIPDGPVMMNTYNSCVFTNNVDFITSPIVLHYNSMNIIKSLNVLVDNTAAILEKNDESFDDEDDYFKTDSRYEYYYVETPVRGSEIEYEYTELCRDAKFNSVFYVPEKYFTLKKTIRIALPENLNFEIVEMNFSNLSFKVDTILDYAKGSSKTQKTKYLEYTFYKLKPLSFYEKGRGPSYSYPLIYIYYKSAQVNNKKVKMLENTNDLYNWYKLVNANLKNDTAVFSSFVKNLVKDQKTDIDKIKTVYYWIQDNIRYIAFEDGIAGFRAEECSEVYEKKYGDCKGMANLTKNMLQVLGYDAKMVFIGTKHQNFSYKKPGMPVDNHAICAVKLNNKFIFLDGTESFCAINEYANRIQGRQCIVENGDGYSVETIPEFDYTFNEIKQTNNAIIEKGNIVSETKIEYNGESRLDFIRSYNLLRTENKEESLYHFLTRSLPNIKIKNIKTSDLENREIVANIQYQQTIMNKVIETDTRFYVNLNTANDLEYFANDTNSTTDVNLNLKFYYNQVFNLKLNDNQALLVAPPQIKIDNEYYSFFLDIKQVGNTLVYTKKLIAKKDFIPQSLAKQFFLDIKTLMNYYNSYVEISK